VSSPVELAFRREWGRAVAAALALDPPPAEREFLTRRLSEASR
jgi:hypothetical protein